jgi:hypothetical protein
MNMKDLRLRVVITLLLLLGLPIWAAGQDQISSESHYIYGYDSEDWQQSASADDIYPIQIVCLTDEFTARKRPDVNNEDFESIVKRVLPDAAFIWENPSATTKNICSIRTECADLDNAISILSENDSVMNVGRMYIRKTYHDLMKEFPVSKVATFGFADEITFTCLNNETFESAKSLFESMGLEIANMYRANFGTVKIQKGMNVIAVANQLHESGFFFLATPSKVLRFREMDVQPLDLSTLPYYYDYYGNKVYWYVLSDRILIRKSPSIDKNQMESIIKDYVEGPDIIWDNDSICTVVINPEQIENAMNALSKENAVLRVSNKYFSKGTYELVLGQGLKNPDSFGLDGKLSLYFKEDISQDDRDGLVRDYNLHLVADGRFSSEYEVPDSLDVLEVCRSIFETGLVEYCEPNTTYIAKLIFFNPSSSTTGVEPIEDVTELKTEYYNLLGRRMEEPSGLTIKVTHYSNGTIRSEKQLFEK